MLASQILISIIGFSLNSITLDQVAKKISLPEIWYQRFRSGLLMFFLVMQYVMLSSQDLLWFFIAVNIFLITFSPLFVNLYLRTLILGQQIVFLTTMILNMQTGKPFRPSFKMTIRDHPSWFARQLDEIFEAIINQEKFAPMSTGEMSEFSQELFRIDQTQTKVIDQLKRFRDHLKMIEQFRRRSSAATTQARAQLLVLSLMYVALGLFIAKEFGFLANWPWFLGSLFFFCLGLVLMYRIAKRFKWNI